MQSGEVHAVARSLPRIATPGVQWHAADLLAPGVARELARSVAATHLVHLAWNVTPGVFWSAPDNLDWVATSLELYRGFAEAGGKRCVMTGTCAEYDWQNEELNEITTPCRPATLYGQAKHSLHDLLRVAARHDKISLAWARLFFLYGPHEAASRLVPDVINSVLRGKPALCGDGLAERDFMYVTDVAVAIKMLLFSDYAGPVNIASGTCAPLRDIIEGAAASLARPDLVRLGARAGAPGEPRRLAAKTEILNHTIGFRPEVSLREGLAASAAWWRSQLGS